MTNKHYHHEFMTWDGELVEGIIQIENNLVRVSVIENQNEESAMEAAKAIVSREHYKLDRAWECSSPDTGVFYEKQLKSQEMQRVLLFEQKMLLKKQRDMMGDSEEGDL